MSLSTLIYNKKPNIYVYVFVFVFVFVFVCSFLFLFLFLFLFTKTQNQGKGRVGFKLAKKKKKKHIRGIKVASWEELCPFYLDLVKQAKQASKASIH